MGREGPWMVIWRRLLRHRLAVAAGVFLVMLHGVALFADFVAPYSEGESNRRKFFHPPSTVHFRAEDGRPTRPFVYATTIVDVGLRQYEEVRAAGRYPIHLFTRGTPYRLLGLIPTEIHLFGVESPAVLYLFGADMFGRDVFSRILHGSRKTLFIGIVGIAVATSIGLVYGGVAGFYGGAVDHVMMRMAEVVLAFPSFYLLLTLSAVLPLNFPSSWRFAVITFILGMIGWAGIARVIRGMVLSLRQREFIEGAQAIGCSNFRTITRHILPNTLSYVVVSATLAVPGFIIGESALSFVGVGIQEPQASWGNMLQQASNILAMTQHPWLLVPGLFIFVTVLSYSFFGDGLRDALDPKSRG